MEKWLDRPEAFAIKGPRQSGKTTLLKLLSEKVRGKTVFLNFEDPDILESFEKDTKGFIKSFISGPERHYFLMDEYHYVRDAGKKLKLLYDTLERTKFIVTGSSSLELGEGMGRFLVGRVFFFELLPFSFREFLLAKDERLARIHQEENALLKSFLLGGEIEVGEDVLGREFQQPLVEYLTYGGYPAVVTAEDAETKRAILKGIYDTYISRDVVGFLRFKDAFRYRDTVKAFAASLGGLLNYHELSSEVGSYFKELKRIVSILCETYILFLLRPFFRNPRTELRKTPKVYFFDLGLRNYIINNFNPLEIRTDVGEMIENFALLELVRMFPDGSINYWRTIAGAEVDFVMRIGEDMIPIEVKYGRIDEPKISRGLRSFIKSYSPRRALVLSRELWAIRKVGGTEILFAPLCYV
ncbi:MAG: ATP-binding protein [Candidatus Hadarchaeales archaeon]